MTETQVTPTETPVAQTQTTPDAVASAPTPSMDIKAQGTEAPAPTYAPDYKFKAYDKEYEIEELYRGLIKDKETEEKIKQFHSKAYGFDGLKEKHESLRNEHKSVAEKYQSVDSNLKTLSSYVKAGDLGSFFEALNLPKEMIFGFVKKELEKMSAPPEQRAQMEEFERIRRENMSLKAQQEDSQSRQESQALQTKMLELDTAISRPDVAPISAQLDAKLGSGAFRRAVTERGMIAFHTTGQEISVAQAVQEAIAYWTPFLSGAQQGDIQQAHTPQATTSKPTLPNVGGRSTSPIKSGPRSIDDLKKAAMKFGT